MVARLRPLFIAAAILALLGLSLWTLMPKRYPTPEAALAEFYGGEPRGECMINQPLRMEGQRVVPLVIRELPNKAMPRRRYAIAFLGYGRYAEALPTLQGILVDQTEIDYFRADALLAIYEISPARAGTLSSELVNLTGHLKQVVDALGRGDAAVRMFINHSC